MKKIYAFMILQTVLLVTILLITLGSIAKAAEKHPLVGWELPIKAYCTDLNELEIWFRSGIIQESCVNIPHKPIIGTVKAVLKPVHLTKDYTFWMVRLESGLYAIVIIPDPK